MCAAICGQVANWANIRDNFAECAGQLVFNAANTGKLVGHAEKNLSVESFVAAAKALGVNSNPKNLRPVEEFLVCCVSGRR